MADVTLNFFDDNQQGWGAIGVWEGRWRVVYEVHWETLWKKKQIVTNDIYKLKKALFTDASRALC